MSNPNDNPEYPNFNDILEEEYATSLKVDEEIEKNPIGDWLVDKPRSFSEKEFSTYLRVSVVLGRVGNLIKHARNDERRRKREAESDAASSDAASKPARPITWSAQVQSWAETFDETERARRNMTRKRSVWFGWKPESSTSV